MISSLDLLAVGVSAFLGSLVTVVVYFVFGQCPNDHPLESETYQDQTDEPDDAENETYQDQTDEPDDAENETYQDQTDEPDDAEEDQTEDQN